MAKATVFNDIKSSGLNNPPTSDALTDFSQKDAPWDTHRAQADAVARIYAASQKFEGYAARMGFCSGVLRFASVSGTETGEAGLKLREAHFCRVRHCPVCQWRRSLMWQARFLQSLPSIVESNPKARWIFLTLTVRNCAISELGETLKEMNAAFHRLVKRKEFKPVIGWIRSTEVTRGKDGSAHPHFHTLMMVPPSMIAGTNYVKQERWRELWQECGRFGYSPIVDVRAVKRSSTNSTDEWRVTLQGVVAETFKYSVKPSDMVLDAAWFLEMTRQVYRKRFISAGGVLKDVLRIVDDLIGEDSAAPSTMMWLVFSWREHESKYRRAVQFK